MLVQMKESHSYHQLLQPRALKMAGIGPLISRPFADQFNRLPRPR